MKRTVVLAYTMALAMSMIAGSAAAAPTQAKHYAAFEDECEQLGSIVIEIVSPSDWSTAKVQGTNLTLIRRWFDFKVTHVASDTVVFTQSETKRNTAVDDVCRVSYYQDVPDDNPQGLPGGTYLHEATVGVKVVGQH